MVALNHGSVDLRRSIWPAACVVCAESIPVSPSQPSSPMEDPPLRDPTVPWPAPQQDPPPDPQPPERLRLALISQMRIPQRCRTQRHAIAVAVGDWQAQAPMGGMRTHHHQGRLRTPH
jgi:hypothetical protein